MQRSTWLLATLGLLGGLSATSYLQEASSHPGTDPTLVLLANLGGEVQRLQGELKEAHRQLARIDESEQRSQELAGRLRRLEAELLHARHRLERQTEHLGRLESSTREAAVQAVDLRIHGLTRELDAEWAGLRGRVDEISGLATRHEGTLRELSRNLSRDTDRMWSELLGPTVQLSGTATVGSGVLLPSIPIEDGRFRTYLLTAWHVVRDIQSDPKNPIDPVPVHVYLRDGGKLDQSALLLAHDAALDAALLVMESDAPYEHGARLATRQTLEQVAIFGSVYAVGCPLGNDPIPTFGEVADLRHQVDGEPYWMISAPTYIGNSGGGIFDAATHELIGIFSKIYTHGALRPTVVPHMGLVTPLARIYDWLESVGHGDLVPGSRPALEHLSAASAEPRPSARPAALAAKTDEP